MGLGLPVAVTLQAPTKRALKPLGPYIVGTWRVRVGFWGALEGLNQASQIYRGVGMQDVHGGLVDPKSLVRPRINSE